MDVIHLASIVASLTILVVTVYEGLTVVKLIGKMPRFWLFFLLAVVLVIANRLLQILTPNVAASAADSDLVPVAFAGLLLLWIYDMKKAFQRTSSIPRPQLTAAEQIQPPQVGGVVARDDVHN